MEPLPHTKNTRNIYSLFFFIPSVVYFLTCESTKHSHAHSLYYPSLEPCPPRGSTEPDQKAAGGVWGQLPNLVHQRIRWRFSAEPDGACARCQHHLAPRVWGVPSAPGGAPQTVENSGSMDTDPGVLKVRGRYRHDSEYRSRVKMKGKIR